MKRLQMPLLFLLLSCSSPQESQTSTVEEHSQVRTKEYLKKEFKQGDHRLPYRMLYPTDFNKSRTYPLLLFLHGAGERGNDNEAQLKHGGQLIKDSLEKYPAVVLFPQCAESEYWANMNPDTLLPNGMRARIFSEDAEPFLSILAMEALMDSMIALPYIDTTRIYVAGLSMGGMGTTQLLAKYPDRFAAASVICGAAPLQFAEELSQTPTSIYIGLEDPVVAPVYSQHYFQAIDDSLGTHRLFEYPAVDHESWNNAFAEPTFLSWMFEHMRE